jgi:hypothetical protein
VTLKGQWSRVTARRAPEASIRWPWRAERRPRDGTPSR